jgi:hypothetical protein
MTGLWILLLLRFCVLYIWIPTMKDSSSLPSSLPDLNLLFLLPFKDSTESLYRDFIPDVSTWRGEETCCCLMQRESLTVLQVLWLPWVPVTRLLSSWASLSHRQVLRVDHFNVDGIFSVGFTHQTTRVLHFEGDHEEDDDCQIPSRESILFSILLYCQSQWLWKVRLQIQTRTLSIPHPLIICVVHLQCHQFITDVKWYTMKRHLVSLHYKTKKDNRVFMMQSEDCIGRYHEQELLETCGEF